jgi:peptidyl-tRNA hydrolase
MNICVRVDKASKEYTSGEGGAAALVSQAVILAYQKCKEVDPISLAQWEANSWAKICLKVQSAREIDQLEATAAKVGICCTILKKPITKTRTKP